MCAFNRYIKDIIVIGRNYFPWKYECAVFDGTLNKYVYWSEHKVDVLLKDLILRMPPSTIPFLFFELKPSMLLSVYITAIYILKYRISRCNVRSYTYLIELQNLNKFNQI